jgi:hypothetical protein
VQQTAPTWLQRLDSTLRSSARKPIRRGRLGVRHGSSAWTRHCEAVRGSRLWRGIPPRHGSSAWTRHCEAVPGSRSDEDASASDMAPAPGLDTPPRGARKPTLEGHPAPTWLQRLDSTLRSSARKPIRRGRLGVRHGSSAWTRTRDPAVNSRLLYQLSYTGRMVRQTSRSGGHVKWVLAKSAGLEGLELVVVAAWAPTGRAGWCDGGRPAAVSLRRPRRLPRPGNGASTRGADSWCGRSRGRVCSRVEPLAAGRRPRHRSTP